MNILIIGPSQSIYDQQGTASTSVKKMQDFKLHNKYDAISIRSRDLSKIITFKRSDLEPHLGLIDFPGDCGRIYFKRLMGLAPYTEVPFNG